MNKPIDANNGKFIRPCFRYFCKALFTLYCPLQVVGSEKLVKGPVILCSNHCSHLDSAAWLHIATTSKRQLGFLAAYDYFFAKKDSFSTKIMHLIPAQRNSDRDSIKKLLDDCQSFIEGNENYLVIFPEGTRSMTGEILPFKPGVAILSHLLHIPILPCYITGSYRCMPKGSSIPKPGKMQAIVGDLIYPEGNYSFAEIINDHSICNNHTRVIETAIHNLKVKIESMR